MRARAALRTALSGECTGRATLDQRTRCTTPGSKLYGKSLARTAYRVEELKAFAAALSSCGSSSDQPSFCKTYWFMSRPAVLFLCSWYLSVIWRLRFKRASSPDSIISLIYSHFHPWASSW